ncbi:MAG: CRISPR-associated protein Cas4 [Methanobacteriota archaeon]|nr:MAG: CRISPR-associated protein Cas4 [Euryarchaeota archaeon]
MAAATPVFSAGDVEKYGYCPLTWWLSRGDVEEVGKEIVEGITKHEEMGDEILSIGKHEKTGKESETTVLYFAVAATIVAVLGISFVTQTPFQLTLILDVVSLIWLLAAVFFLYRAERLASEAERFGWERAILVFSMVALIAAVMSVTTFIVQDEWLGRTVEAIALVWLIGATFFLRRGLVHELLAKLAREKYRATKGEVTYVDHPEAKPDLLVSEKYGLRGRPDYVIAEGDVLIPVEVKTGRTPRGPLFSHILQLAAYCLLVEETSGKAPPHGIIKYEGASHEIEYNPDLKKLVVGKLEEMRAALRKGEAHRNHQRPGKCIHCSRREVCPERLA